MYLKVDGIDGDTTVEGHKKEMLLLSWSISASMPAGPRTARGSGSAGTSVHGDLSITKKVDEASNKLHAACWSGKTIKEAILTQQRAGKKEGEKVDYLKLTLGDVLVTSTSSSGAPQDIPTETFTLNYAKIKREYRTTTGKGEAGGWQSEGWDIAKEEKL